MFVLRSKHGWPIQASTLNGCRGCRGQREVRERRAGARGNVDTAADSCAAACALSEGASGCFAGGQNGDRDRLCLGLLRHDPLRSVVQGRLWRHAQRFPPPRERIRLLRVTPGADEVVLRARSELLELLAHCPPLSRALCPVRCLRRAHPASRGRSRPAGGSSAQHAPRNVSKALPAIAHFFALGLPCCSPLARRRLEAG